MITDDKLRIMAKASRKTALLSLVSFLIVISALLYSAYTLRELQHKVDLLQNKATALTDTVSARKEQIETLNVELQKAAVEMQASRDVLHQTRDHLQRSQRAAEFVRAGINHYQRGEYEEAITSYQKAVRIDSSNEAVYNWMGYAYYRRRQYAEAIDHLRKSVSVAPAPYALGYYNLALALWQSGEQQEAVASVRKALDINPGLRSIVSSDAQFIPFRQSAEFNLLLKSQ